MNLKERPPHSIDQEKPGASSDCPPSAGLQSMYFLKLENTIVGTEHIKTRGPNFGIFL